MQPISYRFHRYHGGLFLGEHGAGVASQVGVLFVGGLGDNIGTVPYLPALARGLPARVFEVQLLSSLLGWGSGSIVRDAYELGRAVEYVRELGITKVYIMGHSTGCQDVVYYLTEEYEEAGVRGDVSKVKPVVETAPLPLALRPAVDGAILQAAVSDRAAYVKLNGEAVHAQWLAHAHGLVELGQGEEFMPTAATATFFPAPITAARWCQLFESRGQDDYFSADLTHSDWRTTFGKVQVPLLVLLSGADEFVPSTVDQAALAVQWGEHVKHWAPGSGTVPGATHNVGPKSSGSAESELVKRVAGFVAY